MKLTVGAKVDTDIVERLKKVAEVDRRTVSNVLELCILRGLPELEEDLERRKLLDRTSSSPAASEPDVTAIGDGAAASPSIKGVADRVLARAVRRSKSARE